MLISSSKTVQPPHLEIVDISNGKSFSRIRLTNPAPAMELKVETKFVSGEVSPPSIYTGPLLDPTDVNKNSVPLIVW